MDCSRPLSVSTLTVRVNLYVCVWVCWMCVKDQGPIYLTQVRGVGTVGVCVGGEFRHE